MAAASQGEIRADRWDMDLSDEGRDHGGGPSLDRFRRRSRVRRRDHLFAHCTNVQS